MIKGKCNCGGTSFELLMENGGIAAVHCLKCGETAIIETHFDIELEIIDPWLIANWYRVCSNLFAVRKE